MSTPVCWILDGQRKPAWYAFVGDNELTAAGPASAAAGATFEVAGRLTAKGAATTGVGVLLQRAPLVGGVEPGHHAGRRHRRERRLRVQRLAVPGRRYRVVWDGVVESDPLTVNVL